MDINTVRGLCGSLVEQMDSVQLAGSLVAALSQAYDDDEELVCAHVDALLKMKSEQQN